MQEHKQNTSSDPQVGSLHPPENPDQFAQLALLQRIEQLESEIVLKDRVLLHNRKEQTLLRKQLNVCIQSMQEYSKQVADVGQYLSTDFRHIFQRVESLEEEIKTLERANEAWSKRSLTFQFDALISQEEMKTVKTEYELAISKITLLEMELKDVKSENNYLKARVT